MQYTHLGRTGVAISRLCLGTMNFGCYTSEEDSLAIMDKALELGSNQNQKVQIPVENSVWPNNQEVYGT